MEFLEWKHEHGHKHLTEEMKDLMREHEELKALDELVLTEIQKQRLIELEEFVKKIDKMLYSEWQWFIHRIIGVGGDYC